MNQRMNRTAVAALLPKPFVSTAWLRDPKALAKVRRKWKHALDAADEANRKHSLGMGEMADMPLRPYSLCWPESNGPTTQFYDVHTGPCSAWEAMLAASGDVDLFTGSKPVEVIDRTKIVKRELALA